MAWRVEAVLAIRVIEYASASVPAKSACSLLLAQIQTGHDAIARLIPELLPAELGWQPLRGCNTIGMLLRHIAAVEGYWVAVASRRFRSDEEINCFLRKEIGIGVKDDGMPPAFRHRVLKAKSNQGKRRMYPMYVNLNRPGDWNTYAGGTAAAEGRNCYDKTVPGVGQYMIDPVCWPNSLRHRGYIVRVANVFGKLRDQPGLYRDLANYPVSLTEARSIAQAHLQNHLAATGTRRQSR